MKWSLTFSLKNPLKLYGIHFLNDAVDAITSQPCPNKYKYIGMAGPLLNIRVPTQVILM